MFLTSVEPLPGLPKENPRPETHLRKQHDNQADGETQSPCSCPRGPFLAHPPGTEPTEHGTPKERWKRSEVRREGQQGIAPQFAREGTTDYPFEPNVDGPRKCRRYQAHNQPGDQRPDKPHGWAARGTSPILILQHRALLSDYGEYANYVPYAPFTRSAAGNSLGQLHTLMIQSATSPRIGGGTANLGHAYQGVDMLMFLPALHYGGPRYPGSVHLEVQEKWVSNGQLQLA
jgi:hypothetical protein